MAQVWKLLTLIAVLLMPVGMTAAPAAASAPHRVASMPMRDCPASSHDMKDGFAECTMACAASLPAVDRVSDPALPIAHALIAPVVPMPLHGLHPDTATPPPKFS